MFKENIQSLPARVALLGIGRDYFGDSTGEQDSYELI